MVVNQVLLLLLKPQPYVPAKTFATNCTIFDNMTKPSFWPLCDKILSEASSSMYFSYVQDKQQLLLRLRQVYQQYVDTAASHCTIAAQPPSTLAASRRDPSIPTAPFVGAPGAAAAAAGIVGGSGGRETELLDFDDVLEHVDVDYLLQRTPDIYWADGRSRQR